MGALFNLLRPKMFDGRKRSFVRDCHPERSEGSVKSQILRFTQNDKRPFSFSDL